ncbi:MAG: single-stranded DNA-binding protein [Planctomycetota bacterium]|nr:MAG: single-stranded DNA-binding protein [Planctomycetota bacterium]
MASFNKVILMGNLTRDPEMRSTQGGTQICKFGIATNRKFRTQAGEQREEVCYVDVTAFGRQAELINQYMSRGRPIFLEGRLQFSSWETQDGQKRNKLEVVVENFQFMRSGQQGQGGGQQGQGGSARRAPASDWQNSQGGGFGEGEGFGESAGGDDIPF